MQDEILKKTKKKMDKTIKVLKEELKTIRTGRASSNIFDNVYIDYYGQKTPLSQAATISVQDPQNILVKPFDPSVVEEVEKAILSSDLGLNPLVEDNVVRVPIPSLTEQRRKEYANQAKNYAEEAKIAIRNIRRDIKKEIEEMGESGEVPEDYEHRLLDDLQEITDEYTEQIDELLEKKRNKIMEV
ncbi:MAG: ribosome recycling factor [Candidatus Mcinerneyibacterium aminivorans]|uniref:Ribosome-recycling factor n=1 Tax=Candidatus Mcinerneyibacterium aminivorans TaxID=2703815 RepID=A0A5D0MFH7_9BACT|nr:MAG: ribosome recycling factor [Candidatus Mcinerneyibacterium aminivorans]